MSAQTSYMQRFLLVAATLVAMGGLFLLFLSVTARLSDLREAPGDNASWALSQIEVEILLLTEEISAVSETDVADYKDLRRRFNNLYSRVHLIRQSAVFDYMRQDQTFLEQLTKLEKCVNLFIPFIDGPDRDLKKNFPKLKKELERVRVEARDMALTGIKLRSEQSDQERNSFSNLLLMAAAVSITLICFLGLLSYFLFRQHRRSREDAVELQRASLRLKSSFETSLDAIIVANDQGEILDFNEAAETVFGFPKSEAIGVQMAELIIPEQYRAAHYAGMKRFNATKDAKLVGSGRIEITALRKNGEEFPIEISIGHSEDHKGSIFISYIRDITERLAAQENLRIARDEALEAEKTKSNFLAVMSHEMRTPLNGFFGTIELLHETKLTQKQKGYLKLAKNSADILLHHVNDVLDITRLDAGKMELSPKSFDLETFFNDVVTTNASTAQTRQNELILDVTSMPDQPVYLDEHRLRQIVYNLVSNALKFTKNGKVTLKAHVKKTKRSEHILKFSVADTGAGIPEENLSRIFEEFYTQDKSYDRMASGAGLGLAISKRILTLMNGTITVESKLGKGSTFTVCLPFELAKPENKAYEHDKALDQSVLRGKHILLVEDNKINRTIVKEMLQSDGIQVSEAHNGLEAVKAVEVTDFDAILMDVSMPVMNGVDATEHIRASGSKVPILGLTAHALEEEKARFLAAGMNICLSKPIARKSLVKAMIETLKEPQQSTLQDAYQMTASVLDQNILSDVRSALTEEKFQTTLQTFTQEIQELIKVASDMYADQKFEDLSAIVHKSAGSAGILGAAHLQQHLRDLELALKESDLKAAQTQINGLNAIWETTWDQIQNLS